MSNLTQKTIMIVKHQGEVIGYQLPNERCVVGEEVLFSMGLDVPNENPCNVVEV